MRDLAFPAALLGPVLNLAFARFAANCLPDVISVALVSRIKFEVAPFVYFARIFQ
jgi:hypothetical protein